MIKIGSKLIIFVIYYVVVVVDYFSNKSDIILIDASFLLFLISLPCNPKSWSVGIVQILPMHGADRAHQNIFHSDLLFRRLSDDPIS